MPKNTPRKNAHRRIVARGVLRDKPDVRTLARAAIRLALVEAQREAEAKQLAESMPDTSQRQRPAGRDASEYQGGQS